MIVVGHRRRLRAEGRVMFPCAICARLTRHRLDAIETRMYAYFLIPLGEPAVGGHLATCGACDLTRFVREEVGPALPDHASDEELRRSAPKRLRVRGKRLRALHAEAVERGAT